MGVNVPSTYEHDVDVTSIPTITIGSVGPVTLNGIPSSYDIDIDINKLPKISLGIDPLKIEPMDVSVRLKEIPSVRAHLPMNYCVGLSLLGFELANIRLCGESQVITEPYKPNPCEICGNPRMIGTVDGSQDYSTVLTLKE